MRAQSASLSDAQPTVFPSSPAEGTPSSVCGDWWPTLSAGRGQLLHGGWEVVFHCVTDNEAEHSHFLRLPFAELPGAISSLGTW